MRNKKLIMKTLTLILLALNLGCGSHPRYANEYDSELIGEKMAGVDMANEKMTFYSYHGSINDESNELKELIMYIESNNISLVVVDPDLSGIDSDVAKYIEGYTRIFYRKHVKLKKLLDSYNAYLETKLLFMNKE